MSGAAAERGSRFWLFVYSNGNIAGCLGGLVGIALFLLGVIGQCWLPITLGLYLAGYFAAPAPDPLRRRAGITVDTLREALDELIQDSRKRLPAEAQQLLESIRATMDEVLPRLSQLHASLPLDTPQTFTIAETVTRYLPDALDSYVKLPPMYATAHRIDGKTPKQHLVGQLTLLDAKLKDIADDLFRGDAEDLALNGRFLEEKFGARDRLAGGTGKAAP